MFSALKNKFTNSPSPSGTDKTSDAQANSHHGIGINSMNAALQRKFARGVHYNMKLLLRGDRNTGKSCLFKRLQGGTFVEGYTPSDEISVASIQWNYRATDDIVKVEVWDVVDRGKKRKKLESLKMADSNVQDLEPALDAEFVDVYKGAHGVIIMFDVTKSWTLDYVKKEAPKVPKHIPILILANFIDQAHHRCETRAQVVGYVEDELVRGPNAAQVRYAESSMRNGFGLKFLHRFLNLPFLTLQRESLLTQLETNQRETDATVQELDLYLESDDANYEVYSNGVTKKRRAQAESLAPAPTIDVVVGQSSNTLKDPKFQQPLKQQSPTTTLPQKPISKDKVDSPRQNAAFVTQPPMVGKGGSDNVDVDLFVPDTEAAIDNFLEEDNSPRMAKLDLNDVGDDEEEESSTSGNNPMVAAFAEDVEVEEYNSSMAGAELSSDEDEEVIIISTKPALKTKLSNTSSKSPEVGLHFELPDSLKLDSSTNANDLEIAAEKPKKKQKKDKKSKTEKKKTNKQKSEDQDRDVLEEFLNGIPQSSIQPEEGSYEAL